MYRPKFIHLSALAIVFAVGLLPTLAQAQVPNGQYECWFFSSARGGLNFKVNGSSYVGSDGSTGTISENSFRGGANDGVRFQYKGGNPPTVSILGPRGDEVSACQLKR